MPWGNKSVHYLGGKIYWRLEVIYSETSKRRKERTINVKLRVNNNSAKRAIEYLQDHKFGDMEKKANFPPLYMLPKY